MRSISPITGPLTYASFKDENGELPVGIQLTVEGSKDDHFVATRDLLRSDQHLLARYNALKSAHESEND